MRFFFNAELFDNGLHGDLNSATFQRHIGKMGVMTASLAVREEEMRVLVHLPKLPQQEQGPFRQRDQAVFIAFGVTDMDPHGGGIDIADGQPDPFAQAQAEGVSGKEEDPVAHPVGRGKQPVELLYRKDVGDSGNFRRLDQGNVLPGFVEDLGVEEFQAVEVELDRAP